jgi:peptidyl-prolyl cis-trans isomerase C
MRARYWLGTGLVAVLVGTAALRAQTDAKPAAVVNGEAISADEIELVLKHAGPPPATPLTQQQKRQQQLEVLGMLIDDKLVEQYLRKQGAKVDPAEVDKQLAEMVKNLQQQNKTLADFCRESGQSEADVRKNITLMLQWNEYVKGRYSDADVKRYYDDYKDFFDQVRVRASHIVIRVAGGSGDAEAQQVRQKLAGLRQEILAGKLDFAEAAKTHSQCPSAPNGGDIGFFTRKWMVDENFARTAFGLKVGDVSEVIQTDFGFHLIKVTGREPGQPSDFEKIKEEVKEFYVEELRMQLINQQRKAAQIEINIP